MRHQDREGKPFFTDNHEVNDLVSIDIEYIKFNKCFIQLLSLVKSIIAHVYHSILDGQIDSSSSNTFVRIRESSGTMQRLL